MVFSTGLLARTGTISSLLRLMDLRLEDEELEEQLLVRFFRVLVSISSHESCGIGLVARSENQNEKLIKTIPGLGRSKPEILFFPFNLSHFTS